MVSRPGSGPTRPKSPCYNNTLRQPPLRKSVKWTHRRLWLVNCMVCLFTLVCILCLPTEGWPGWVDLDGWMIYPLASILLITMPAVQQLQTHYHQAKLQPVKYTALKYCRFYSNLCITVETWRQTYINVSVTTQWHRYIGTHRSQNNSTQP